MTAETAADPGKLAREGVAKRRGSGAKDHAPVRRDGQAATRRPQRSRIPDRTGPDGKGWCAPAAERQRRLHPQELSCDGGAAIWWWFLAPHSSARADARLAADSETDPVSVEALLTAA
jgi:hypothetical protein